MRSWKAAGLTTANRECIRKLACLVQRTGWISKMPADRRGRRSGVLSGVRFGAARRRFHPGDAMGADVCGLRADWPGSRISVGCNCCRGLSACNAPRRSFSPAAWSAPRRRGVSASSMEIVLARRSAGDRRGLCGALSKCIDCRRDWHGHNHSQPEVVQSRPAVLFAEMESYAQAVAMETPYHLRGGWRISSPRSRSASSGSGSGKDGLEEVKSMNKVCRGLPALRIPQSAGSRSNT